MFTGLVYSKKGADKVISVYWFVVLILIAGGVIAMTYNFYGNPYDVREIEVNLLSDRVADCISYGGVLNFNLVEGSIFKEGFNENFFEECSLKFDSGIEGGEEQYFADIKFYNVSDSQSALFELKKGNLNLIADCEIENKKGKDYKRLVKCTEKRFYSVDDLNNQYLIKILSGVRKTEENVKL